MHSHSHSHSETTLDRSYTIQRPSATRKASVADLSCDRQRPHPAAPPQAFTVTTAHRPPHPPPLWQRVRALTLVLHDFTIHPRELRPFGMRYSRNDFGSVSGRGEPVPGANVGGDGLQHGPSPWCRCGRGKPNLGFGWAEMGSVPTLRNLSSLCEPSHTTARARLPQVPSVASAMLRLPSVSSGRAVPNVGGTCRILREVGL
jgi:hypothetical protein